MASAYIISTGRALAPVRISNEDLTPQFPPAAIPLIERKTGIKARNHIRDGMSTSDLAIQAATDCMSNSPVGPGELDYVIVATSTPDRPIPATAVKLAHAIGAGNSFAFDVNSVCSGSIAVLNQACALVKSGFGKNVLVVAADSYSRILNPKDFSTYPYFGDGAGAALISSTESGIKPSNFVLKSDGGGYDLITVRGGGSEEPFHSLKSGRNVFFEMNGRGVFDFVVSKVPTAINELLLLNGVGVSDISAVILHQANMNILKKVSELAKIPFELFFHNLEEVGNMAGASVLYAFDEFIKNPSHEDGNVVLFSFGGGLSYGGTILRIEG